VVDSATAHEDRLASSQKRAREMVKEEEAVEGAVT
jgi:hypothetical protein